MNAEQNTTGKELTLTALGYQLTQAKYKIERLETVIKNLLTYYEDLKKYGLEKECNVEETVNYIKDLLKINGLNF